MTISAFLPSNDPLGPFRAVGRSIARLRYRYRTPDVNAIDPVAAARCFPLCAEIYSVAWGVRHLPLVLRALGNRTAKQGILRVRALFDEPDSLEPYRAIPGSYHRTSPDVLDYRDDGLFAFRRVAGACPIVLARVASVAELTDRMPDLDEATFRAVTHATEPLTDAIAGGRILVADYAKLADALRPPHPANHRDSRFRGKYLPAPVLVLYDRPANGAVAADLVPVAITADQPGTTPNPMFTPRDDMAWQIAKYYVEVADNNWHFGIGHLWRCHFVMEAFAMATRRHLAKRHPIRMLLDPHLRFTLFTNVVAYEYFRSSGKLYDVMYSGSLEESRALFEAASLARTSVLEHLPSRDLAARKTVASPARYPWREDALEWEAAIRTYVTTIVGAYYPNAGAIRADGELVAWARELEASTGGNLAALFPALDAPSLIEALTLALYTAGPGHSAIHFPMFDLYTFAPTGCESANAPPPTSAAEATPMRFRQTLPKPLAALENFFQVEIGHFRYDRFGHFDEYAIGKLDRAAMAVADLQAALVKMATRIEAREASAPPRRKYPYLHPSLVTNSVNI